LSGPRLLHYPGTYLAYASPTHEPRVSTQGRSEKRMDDSAEFASQLAPLAEVDKLDGDIGCLNK